MTKNNKLTSKDYGRMWGEDGPYSQVRLAEETRILDDGISRIFLMVEADINPFTFEFVEKNRRKFVNDNPVLEILENAQYSNDKFGYVVSAGEVEFRDAEALKFARKQADITTQALMRMHAFVMNEYGLKREERFGIIKDKTSAENRYVWNQITGRVEPFDDNPWGAETLVSASAGVEDNKMRSFFVLAYARDFVHNKDAALVLAKNLKIVAENLQIKIEEVENFHEYLLIVALLPFDISPEGFVRAVFNKCNKNGGKPIFQNDYFVTNVKRPTPDEIVAFLGQLRKKGKKNARSVREEFSDKSHGQVRGNAEEGQMTMEKILERRKELEQEIKEMLKVIESDFEFEDVIDAIYNEEETDDMTKIVAMFDRGGDASELENVLELIIDAWNYFPHKILGGLSPMEKSLECRD